MGKQFFTWLLSGFYLQVLEQPLKESLEFLKINLVLNHSHTKKQINVTCTLHLKLPSTSPLEKTVYRWFPKSFFFLFLLFILLKFSVLFLTALLKYNWYTKNCKYLMCTMMWGCTYVHTQYHHQHQENRQIQHFPKFPHVPWFCVCVCVCVVRTPNMRSTLSNFEVHNTVLLTIGSRRTADLLNVFILHDWNFIPLNSSSTPSPIPSPWKPLLHSPSYIQIHCSVH